MQMITESQSILFDLSLVEKCPIPSDLVAFSTAAVNVCNLLRLVHACRLEMSLTLLEIKSP
jgi:hypothetical protein